MSGPVGLGVNPNANRWLAMMTRLVRVPRIRVSRSRTDPKRRSTTVTTAPLNTVVIATKGALR
jgi:hypothetical protein